MATRLQVVERAGARDAAGKALYDAMRAHAGDTQVPRSALPWEMLTEPEAEMWRARAWAAVEAYVAVTVDGHAA